MDIYLKIDYYYDDYDDNDNNNDDDDNNVDNVHTYHIKSNHNFSGFV
jgi:hypothetical protein